MDSTIILIAVAVVIVLILVYVYNGLVKFKLRGENAFSQIDVQLKRRYDLIPNLVETAKAYLKHEAETLQAVVQARNAAASVLEDLGKKVGDQASTAALTKAEGQLSSAMGSFQVAVEAYPDLKASANMIQLNEELSSTENKIAFARQAFNDAVNMYNDFRQSIPAVIFAGLFGHGNDMSFLTFEEGEALKKAPTVKF